MSFEVHQPTSVTEAVDLATSLAPHARFLAGGTDLIIQINRRRCSPRHLIALNRIEALRGIALGADGIHLGALTTHKMIERHPAFAGALIALQEAARVIGGHQIRNIATIGGNVVNASPAADVVPGLLALDAAAVLTGQRGTRRLPLAAFLHGPGETYRRDDEVLERIAFTPPPARSASSFIKAGRRRAREISVVCVAALMTLDAEGYCAVVRIALGAVGPTTLRATAAEQALQGQAPTPDRLREAGRLAADACLPISDVRASAEYRRMLVEALVPRALRRCLDRISEAPS
jgi:carbon-monoxide dehydrogenase medium subunit